jgi:cytochrome P450
VQSCVIEQTTDDVRYDIDRLLEQPVLQAVYAETLRLRVNGFLVRYPSKEDLRIHDWSIPKNHLVFTCSTPGHMNPKIWCSGSNRNHPADEFWPGRFLKYTQDLKLMEFSTETAKGSWMPYGGGSHACPGRHFAKLEIILTMALLVTLYDCEVLGQKKSIAMSTRNFGFGALSPVDKVPVRIRRRAAEWHTSLSSNCIKEAQRAGTGKLGRQNTQ